MKIYITRHGETEWNKAGRMQGWKNSSLSPKGIENAKTLGESLKFIDFDCIYSSPLGRAVETAEYIRGNKNTKIIFKDTLKEIGIGLWEGMSHLEIQEQYPEEHHHFWHQPHLYQPIDGESYESLMERSEAILKEIISEAPGENVLIVSHGVVIKAICTILKKFNLEDFWQPPFIEGTSLTVLEIEDGEIKMILEADVSHLD